MANLNDILTNKSQYPDDQKIMLADGVEATLGELRGGFQRQADYSRKTQEVARDRRELETAQQTFLESKAEAEGQLAAMARDVIERAARAGQPMSGQQALDLVEQDPVGKQLRQELRSQSTELAEVKQHLAELREEARKQVLAQYAWSHRRTLDRLKTSDPELDEGSLIEFAKQKRIPDLEDAYRLSTEEARWAKREATARSEERTKALDEAKRTLLQPPIPQRRTIPPSPDAPKTLDEAADAAANDPEILAILQGG